jgi:hypothetical protein
MERATPFPYEASKDLLETPRSAYELLKLELSYFMQNHFHFHARLPTSDEMQLEACRIILASEALSGQEVRPASWLRDVITSREDILLNARFRTVRLPAEGRLPAIKINGKDNLFDNCEFESQLNGYAELQGLLDMQITSRDLQQEACRIVGQIEDISSTPSDFIASWLIRLMNSSTAWLSGFQGRNGISGPAGPDDGFNADATIHDYSFLEPKLTEFLEAERIMGNEPTDARLRRQARIIVHLSDEGWGQTAADDEYWMAGFKQRHQPADLPAWVPPSTLHQRGFPMPMFSPKFTDSSPAARVAPAAPQADHHLVAAARSLVRKPGSLHINDANYFQWIEKELTQWVAATMSPHNPACHVPSDQEIQHYARWVSFNEECDDPFNVTLADSEIWLSEFKRKVGILI